MASLRFGVIGAGMAGQYFGEALRDLQDADLVAVAARTEASARRFAEQYGAREVYTDWRRVIEHDGIDAVCVITPPGLHAEMVTAAAEAGKHVIVEKPMARNLLEADRMIEVCARHGVTLGVIFMYRFMDTALQIKRAVDEGRLGRLVYGECCVPFYRDQAYYDSGDWRGTWEGEGGGGLMSQVIHTLDLLLWVMGDVERVSGEYATLSHDIAVDDVAVATLRFRSGALGVVHGGTALYPGSPRRLVITGERGTVALVDDAIADWRLADASEEERRRVLGARAVNRGDTYSKPGFASSELHRLQLADFIAAVREGRPPLVDGREGRRALEVIRAIYQACDTGRAVDLPLRDDPSYGRFRRRP